MAILNFPDHPQTGDQYTGDNGTTYVFDGVKWLGTAGSGTNGTNSIVNNGNTVQVDSTGKLVLPAYALPNTTGTNGQVLKWPSSGTTLVWANDNNSGGGGSGSSLTNGGYSVSLGVDGYLNLPNGLDTAGALLQSESPIRVNSNGHFWTFGADGKLSFPPTVASPVGTTTQAFGMGNLFAWEDGDNWTIATGNPSTGAFGETGISISPGIESYAYLNLPSDTDIGNGATTTLANANGNVVLQSADGNWVFGKDNSTIFPNSTLISDKLSIQGAPYTIQITDSGGVWGGAIGTYIRLPGLGDPKWVPSNYNASSDSYITFSNGVWSLNNPNFAHPVYVNTGTLYSPSATWNPDTQFGLGSGNPTGAYTYKTWLFDVDGSLTFPQYADGNPPTAVQYFGMGNLFAETDGIYTVIGTADPATGNANYAGIGIMPGIESQTGVYIPNDAHAGTSPVWISNNNTTGQVQIEVNQKSWYFNADGNLTIPTGGDIKRNGVSVLGGGGGGVVFRTVSYPAGASGDTQGTIAVDNTGKIYLCLTTWAASSTVTYSATNNTDYAISQSAGHLLAYQITPSTLPDIQTLFGTFNNYQYNYPTPGDFTLEVPGITGPRTVTACGYLSGNGDIWFDIAYVSGDPTTVSIGDAVTIHYTPQQPAIWEKVGATGNIKFDGQSISTDIGSSIYITSTSNSGDDTEVDIGTNYVDLYTYNNTSNSSAEIYLNNSDHTNPYAYIYTQAQGHESKQWTFNKDGNIVFPDDTVQTTAYRPTSTDPTVWAVQASSQTKVSATQAVAYDSQGNAFALMFQGPWSGGGETRSSIIKLDSHGNTLWAKDLYNGDSVNPWSLCCDPDDNIYAVVERPVGGIYNNTLVKLDGSNGAIIWQVDIQDSQTANNMQVVYYGNPDLPGVVVAGTAYNGTDNDFFIAFVSSDGSTPVGTTTFGDAWDQQAYSIAANGTTGDVLMVGVNKSNTDDYYYLEMVKLGVGGIIWQKKVNVTGDTTHDVTATDCVLLGDGNWAILATHNQSGSQQGVITMKVSNTDGSILWSRETSQGCTNVSSSMTVGADGHMYVSATTYNNSSNQANIPLVSRMIGAYDTDGNILWQKFLGAPGSNLLLDNNWWNNIGTTGKVLAIHGTNLLVGASLIPMTPYPSNQLGVVAQITTSGSDLVLGPYELTSTYLPNPPVTLTSVDSTFATTSGGQTLALSDNISVTASALTYTLFHSGIQPNQLAAGTKTVTLQTNGTLVNETGNNVLGEFNGFTENTGNYGNSQISIRNTSGYKRINNLDSAPQTWFNVADVATQLGVNQYWITSVSMEFQVTSSGIGDYNGYGTMVGTILMAYAYAYPSRTSVTHTETAITNTPGTSDDFVFSALDLWNAPDNNDMRLRARRTDSNTGQQLDIMWTAKVFINPMLVERYC